MVHAVLGSLGLSVSQWPLHTLSGPTNFCWFLLLPISGLCRYFCSLQPSHCPLNQLRAVYRTSWHLLPKFWFNKQHGFWNLCRYFLLHELFWPYSLGWSDREFGLRTKQITPLSLESAFFNFCPQAVLAARGCSASRTLCHHISHT